MCWSGKNSEEAATQCRNGGRLSTCEGGTVADEWNKMENAGAVR